MDTAMTFTPGQILVLCGAIITISGAASVLFNMFIRITAPNRVQNARLDAIELKLEKHDELFKRDLDRFEGIEKGSRVTQRAILALLAHGIDGNDIDDLRKAKSELQEYLIGR